MDQAASERVARDGYDRMAEIYRDHVALEMTVPSLTRSALEAFAHQVLAKGSGRVADVGCGPGHVTAFLAELGLDIVGVDISPELVAIARANHPDVEFELGALASLPFETDSVGAVVAKHSIIHTPAELLPEVLDELARVLTPGGSLFLSFFGAADPSRHGEAFDHAVTTAYQLDVDAMGELVSAAGFAEEARIVRQPRSGERPLPHGTLLARLGG